MVGKGRGVLIFEGCLFDILALRVSTYLREGHLKEHGYLCKEIWLVEIISLIIMVPYKMFTTTNCGLH